MISPASFLSKPQSSSSPSVRLSTLLDKGRIDVPNQRNASIISDFCKYMQDKGSSENHQVNNLKVVIDFAKFLGAVTFYEVKERDQITCFLNKKIKSIEQDPEKRWITTWNHYMNRIKLFFRWLYNNHLPHGGRAVKDIDEWITPEFCKIKAKHSKRVSPYSESELWEREEILSLLKYEPSLRNKAILSLMWDLNARPHEITLLQIRNIRLRDAYGEGEIPYQAKTGGGPVLLMMSFCYVRDWLNQHPFKNEPKARLICNLNNGSPIKPKAIWNIMNQLRNRIIRILEDNELPDEERQKLEDLIKIKKWNPYAIRHSSITADSDYLPDYALKKKVRWSMNSKQGNRYIKRRMGNDLKNKILEYNGITVIEDQTDNKSIALACGRCKLKNAREYAYCIACSYPLTLSAFEEQKLKENEIKNIKENESYNAEAIEVLSDRLTKALEDIEELRQKVT